MQQSFENKFLNTEGPAFYLDETKLAYLIREVKESFPESLCKRDFSYLVGINPHSLVLQSLYRNGVRTFVCDNSEQVDRVSSLGGDISIHFRVGISDEEEPFEVDRFVVGTLSKVKKILDEKSGTNTSFSVLVDPFSSKDLGLDNFMRIVDFFLKKDEAMPGVSLDLGYISTLLEPDSTFDLFLERFLGFLERENCLEIPHLSLNDGKLSRFSPQYKDPRFMIRFFYDKVKKVLFKQGEFVLSNDTELIVEIGDSVLGPTTGFVVAIDDVVESTSEKVISIPSFPIHSVHDFYHDGELEVSLLDSLGRFSEQSDLVPYRVMGGRPVDRSFVEGVLLPLDIPDGSHLHFSNFGSLLFSHRHQIRSLVNIINTLSISPKDRSERLIREFSNRYREIFSNPPYGQYVVGRETGTVYSAQDVFLITDYVPIEQLDAIDEGTISAICGEPCDFWHSPEKTFRLLKSQLTQPHSFMTLARRQEDNAIMGATFAYSSSMEEAFYQLEAWGNLFNYSNAEESSTHKSDTLAGNLSGETRILVWNCIFTHPDSRGLEQLYTLVTTLFKQASLDEKVLMLPVIMELLSGENMHKIMKLASIVDLGINLGEEGHNLFSTTVPEIKDGLGDSLSDFRKNLVTMLKE